MRTSDGLADQKAVPALPQPDEKGTFLRATTPTRLGLDPLQTQNEHTDTHADQSLHARLLPGSRLAKRNPRLASLNVGV
jgi:hypothetical protein